MSQKIKILLSSLFVLILFSSFASGITNNESADSFIVSKDGEKIAKLSIMSNKNYIKSTIERIGQADHTYTKSLINNNVTVKIGKEEVLVYNNTSGDFQLENLDSTGYPVKNIDSNISQLKWTKNKFTNKSLAVQNLLSGDMKIFSVFRNFDNKTLTRSFELAYVILTSDESLYWSKDSEGYSVKSLDQKVKNSVSFVKTSL